ncbi:MAG: phosphate ABC transporter permease subunit PstC [Rhodospirillales bacterium]|jgi:phosphate transport system permease protein
MDISLVFLAVLVLAVLGMQVGRSRAMAAAGGQARTLHSRVGYYGAFMALAIALPAFMVLFVWTAVEPTVIQALVRARLPAEIQALQADQLSLVLTTIENLAYRNIPPSQSRPYLTEAAALMRELHATANWLMVGVCMLVALGGFFLARGRITAEFRARNTVESVVKILMIVCSSIAILTTIGIVMSMLVESLHFFAEVSPLDFFLGLVWDPRFAGAARADQTGQFGLIPLLWGTLFISFVAMLVAVPIGLLSAVYMSEYAGSKFRKTAKPLLEVLAGIPTVVYGFFALITIGPALRDVGAIFGLDISSTSVLCAGSTMGIMIIPFVSSLSDDIINAVPQSLRDASYGLGATQSETIRQVILPAALPGIVGACLLAVSRALGETMIVVMAAGIAAKLTANPFDSVTTMTVKIVAQLTGDLEFNSPQTLVAFALGLTLFVITLGLNVMALAIVRKYREKYD